MSIISNQYIQRIVETKKMLRTIRQGKEINDEQQCEVSMFSSSTTYDQHISPEIQFLD